MDASLRDRAEPALARLVGRRGFDIVAFVVFALVLVLANRAAIEARNVEYSDFAANSLLIQVAKTGHLFVGNYSRVGFNHPGPAILDVLALGEALFFDLLHWVPSPFSGQLVGVALYNAFWMTLIVRLWRRLTIDSTAALCGAAVFFIGAALLDVRFYSGPWFPHLYFFPFATFLFATARLGLGRSDSILSLALSLGFLINGHVAFVPMTGIVMATVLIANRIEYRRAAVDHIVMRSSWWISHRHAILFGVSTVLVFLIPLSIETIRHFPEPIAAYLRVGNGHGKNDLKPSLRFMAAYWGGLPFLLPPIALGVLAYRTRFADVESSHLARVMSAVVLGASLAMTFYAIFGVDYLQLVYVGYFYCVAPALTTAVGISVAMQSTAPSRHRLLLVVASVSIVLVASFKLKRETDYSTFYKGDDIEALYIALEAVPHIGRIVLDLGPADSEHWPVAAGIELVAARRGVESLCIGRGWQILFTSRLRCTVEEVASGPHVVVRSAARIDVSKPAPVAVGQGVVLELRLPASGSRNDF